MSVTTYTVTGMTCGHCVASVTEEISEIEGVTSVDVVLETGLVTVTADRELEPVTVQTAIAEAGYAVTDPR